MNEKETIVMNDLDQFVRTLVGWHNHQVACLENMMDAPPGLEVQVMDGTPVVLQDDLLKGFVIGVYTALTLLGKLPFSAEMDESNEAVGEHTVH